MGGVVTNTFAINTIYEKLNITAEDFIKICSLESDNIWNQFQTGKISAEDFWSKFNYRSSRLKEESFKNIPQVKHDLFRLYFHPSKNPETIELIEKLKRKHRVVCGTNTIQSHWENHMERGDYSFFNQTYASNKIGCAKPDPDFFRLILEAEASQPNNTFFTDDRIENVQAAKALGINAVLFTGAKELSTLWQDYL